MADKTVAHYAIQPQLFNDICQVLEQIPGSAVRRVVNRIENLDGKGECQPVIIEGPDFGGKKKTSKKNVGKSPSRKKVAKRKGGK